MPHYDRVTQTEAARGKRAAEIIVETMPKSGDDFFANLIDMAERNLERNPAYWSAYIEVIANRNV